MSLVIPVEVTVTVEKTVQEQQYEPIRISMTTTAKFSAPPDANESGFLSAVRQNMYDDMEKDIREAMGKWMSKRELSDLEKERLRRRKKLASDPGAEVEMHHQD